MKSFTNQLSKILTIVLLILSTNLVAEPASARLDDNNLQFFVGSWENALEISSLINLPIFVYVYTGYTPACRRMDKHVFSDYHVIKFYKDNFLNYKINLNSEEGMRFLNEYKFDKYPTFLFFNKQGQLTRREVGELDADGILSLGQETLTALPVDRPVNKLHVVYSNHLDSRIKYENGVNHPDFLKEYAYQLKKFNEPYEKVVDEYIEMVGLKNIAQKEYAQFVYDFSDNLNGKAFQLLLQNKRQYMPVLGRQRIIDQIKKAARIQVINAVTDQNQALLNKTLSHVVKANLPDAKEFALALQAEYYSKTRQWKPLSTIVIDFFEENKTNNVILLDEMAWLFATHIQQKGKLSNALQWAKKAVELQPNDFQLLVTEAALWYRLNKKSKAQKVLDKAKKLAKQQGKNNYTIILKLEQVMSANRVIPEDLK